MQKMEQDVAKRLFTEGGALVLLDVPERTEFGIDYNSWTVGPKFKGVKMIPPGFHFIFYSAVNRQGQLAPRTGFFHFFQRQEVIVKRWDPSIEDITDEGIDADTAEKIKNDLKSLDPFLGAYPYEFLSKWVSLTTNISSDLVSRLQPLCGKVSSVTQVHPVSGEKTAESADMVTLEDSEAGLIGKSESSQRKEEDMEEGERKEEARGEVEGEEKTTPGGVFAGVGKFSSTVKVNPKFFPQLKDLDMNYVKEATLRLSPIPSHEYPKEATPSQISHYNIDLSFTMETMLFREYNNSDGELLGEIQFCFICFLVGHVYDAFEHWKELVKLSCLSEEALATHSLFFLNFITVLHFQLKEIPEDFFVDIVSRNNFLTATLQTFFSNLEESGDKVDPVLVKRGLQFRDNLTKKYKWDFSSEPDEFAPTIVDLV